MAAFTACTVEYTHTKNLKTLYPQQRFVAMETASANEGKAAKPKLLNGAYQKFVAAIVGKIQYKVPLAL